MAKIPGAFFLNAYAATVALLNAIDKAGSTDYEAIKAALTSEYVETPLVISVLIKPVMPLVSVLPYTRYRTGHILS